MMYSIGITKKMRKTKDNHDHDQFYAVIVEILRCIMYVELVLPVHPTHVQIQIQNYFFFSSKPLTTATSHNNTANSTNTDEEDHHPSIKKTCT